MFELNGIVYSGEPAPVRVDSVKPLNDYKLMIGFTNGEKRVFDFEPLLSLTCYQPLRDKAVFDRAYVDCGTVCWNDGDIDIAPETLYEQGVAENAG